MPRQPYKSPISCSPDPCACTPCFSNWVLQATGELCLDGSSKGGCRDRQAPFIAGLFLPHSGGTEEFLSKRTFLSHPEKSQQRNPCSLHSHGEQLGDEKLACCTSGRGTSVVVLQGIRCDFSEPSVMSKLKLLKHRSRLFILFGLGPQPQGHFPLESQPSTV